MLRNFLFIVVLSLLWSCSKSKEIDISATSRFSLLSQDITNITFNNIIKEDYNNFFGVFNYAYNGAGVAVGDINNDGLPDIYFIGNQVQDKLYLNKGDFVFEDITQKAGIKPKKAWHNGVTMADVNGDNLLDIYVTVGGWNEPKQRRKNLLYINQGNATFKESASIFGIADTGFSLSASFFDMDNDNDLDLFVTNRPKDFFLNSKNILKGKQGNYDSFRDKIYQNNDGKFVDVSLSNGIKNTFGYGLGLTTSDLDNDGNIDVYVGNDFFENDYYFKNTGNGIFDQQIQKFSNHISYFTMGVDAFDVNNDGFEDLFTLDMFPQDYVRSKTTMAPMNVEQYNYYLSEGFYNQYMHNALHINHQNGFFSDISQLAGVSRTDWSWACLGADFDNDGDNDIFVSNGYKRDLWDRDANAKRTDYTSKPIDKSKSPNQIISDIVNLYPSVKLQNYIFKNEGNLSFTNTADKWGLKDVSFSNGAAFGDFDNDGDLDLVVNNIDEHAFMYRNNSNQFKTNYIKLKLQGPKNNTTGLGAKITLYHKDSIQYKEFKTARGYLSSSEPILHFGLHNTKTIDSIKVLWKDQKTSLIKNIKANQQITVQYKNAITKKKRSNTVKNTLLTQTTINSLGSDFKHDENEYNDYKYQVLLPHKLSSLGPAIAVGDINNDGLEDFYFGGAKDQTPKLVLQNAKGKFAALKQPSFTSDATYEDVYAHFFDADNDKDLDLFVVSGGNEHDDGHTSYTDRLYLNNGKGIFSKSKNLPLIKSSGSCIVPIDFDNDGDLDLFIGSRHVPKKYPSPPSSFVLENQNGTYKDVTDTVAPIFRNLGMVTSAVSSNIDNDPQKELIIVGEWMKIHVFKFIAGSYKEVTQNWGLDKTHGWWNRIVANDIDNDGDMDFVVGNLGLNYKFKASPKKPFLVFANDYDQNGTQDIFLAKKLDDNKLVPIRGKQCSSEQLPHLQEKFKSYREFANAELFDIIGKDQKSAIQYKAEIFESVILINDNGKFKIKPLPIEAQFSVINGILIEDLNKDGIKDIIIGGNRFEVEIETTRSDASVGLVLLGTATGEYHTLHPSESGLFIPQNVKDLKAIKLAGNKIGILVAVNDGALQLYSD